MTKQQFLDHLKGYGIGTLDQLAEKVLKEAAEKKVEDKDMWETKMKMGNPPNGVVFYDD